MLQAVRPELVLASGSAIRLELLQAAGLCVTARAVPIDEAAIKRQARAQGAEAADTALRLARCKAAALAVPDALVIGCDQLLVCDGQWFDKPADPTSARDQLIALRGRSHSLYSAIAICRDGDMIWTHLEQPRLTMRAFSDAALDAYLALEAGRLLVSVGAYRLEGPGIQLFERIEGDHAAILGLPLLPLLHFLRGYGLLLD